ncbi:hypothetical protein [Streptomyces geranii]|uniref:hypothetical protein n=1 Tax=Streptomyces geranii TaxID=2058923 RepID=UPI0018E5948C|nr:hypothetical protein [Streptomyces geranii]
MSEFTLFVVIVVELIGVAGLSLANKKMLTDLPFRCILLGILAVHWGMQRSAESRTDFLDGALFGVVLPALIVRAVEYYFEQREESCLRNVIRKGAWVLVPLQAVCIGMFG